MTHWRKPPLAYLLAAAGPATFYIVMSQLFPASGPEPGIYVFLELLAIVVANAVLGFAVGGQANPVLIAFFAFVGICFGVTANAFYDLSVNHRDHNLFPIEIVVFSILMIPSIVVGMVVGWWIRPKET